jgi:hypothetical protein
MRPFNPDMEFAEARKYRTLASLFEQPTTMGLCERFSILASLCEEKARVLRELDLIAPRNTDEAVGNERTDWLETGMMKRQPHQEN